MKTQTQKQEAHGAMAWLAAAKHVGDLAGYARTYAAAVRSIAIVLRPRFESGELRGWADGDGDRIGQGKRRWTPPMWRVEAACGRFFVRSQGAAMVVLQYASRRALQVDPFYWKDPGGGVSLYGAAVTAMAYDVVLYARARGWSRPIPTEESPPARASTGRAA